MDNFLTKMHRFTTGGLYSPSKPYDARFNMNGSAVFNYFWTVEQKPFTTAILKLGRVRIIFI